MCIGKSFSKSVLPDKANKKRRMKIQYVKYQEAQRETTDVNEKLNLWSHKSITDNIFFVFKGVMVGTRDILDASKVGPRHTEQLLQDFTMREVPAK